MDALRMRSLVKSELLSYYTAEQNKILEKRKEELNTIINKGTEYIFRRDPEGTMEAKSLVQKFHEKNKGDLEKLLEEQRPKQKSRIKGDYIIPERGFNRQI